MRAQKGSLPYRKEKTIGNFTAPNQGKADALMNSIGNAGRDATDGNLLVIAAHIASRGFDLASTRKIGGAVPVIPYNGRAYLRSEKHPTQFAHFLKHAVGAEEWPPGTTEAQYLHSIAEAVRDPVAGIFLCREAGVWQLQYFALAGQWCGPRGGAYILVGYRPAYGWWLTAFQVQSPVAHIARMTNWQDGRWLRFPR